MSEQIKNLKCLNSFTLRILAMACMVCDHLWGTLLPKAIWLNTIGRLTFPIFAFLLVEGFYRTHNRKQYFKRLLIFALISEIPFNLEAEGGLFFPFHQNTLFTLCLAFLLMSWIERARQRGRVRFIAVSAAAVVLGFLLGFVTFVDYYGYGIWMVLLFYFCRGLKYGWVGELAGMVYINWEMIGGLVFPVTLLGREVDIPQQGFAILALIPIWLYSGKRGPHSKALQYACYIFYPVHLTVLYLLLLLVRRSLYGI